MCLHYYFTWKFVNLHLSTASKKPKYIINIHESILIQINDWIINGERRHFDAEEFLNNF